MHGVERYAAGREICSSNLSIFYSFPVELKVRVWRFVLKQHPLLKEILLHEMPSNPFYLRFVFKPITIAGWEQFSRDNFRKYVYFLLHIYIVKNVEVFTVSLFIHCSLPDI